MTTHQDVQEFVQDWWRRDEQEFAYWVKKKEERNQRLIASDHELPLEVVRHMAEYELGLHHRDQVPVGAYLDSVRPQEEDERITTNQLCVVAEIGHDLLYAAVCQADEQDDAEFFETAFSHWGELIEAAITECDLRERCHRCGNVLPDSRRCEQEHDR